MRRHRIALTCAAVLLCLLSAGCGKEEPPVEQPPENPDPVITFLPELPKAAVEQPALPQKALAVADGIGVCVGTVPKDTPLTVLREDSGLYAVELDGQEYFVEKFRVRTEKRKLPSAGTILYEDTELCTAVLEREEEVTVLTRGEIQCLVTVRGCTGTVPRWELRFEDETPFESWTAYSVRNARIWWDWEMQLSSTKLALNTKLTVLGKTDRGLLVETGGKTGFISASDITFQKPPAEENLGDWTPPNL